MWLKYIELNFFRNYSSKKFYFQNKKNLILGKNGSGKTSLLEAIYLACFAKSFRTYNDMFLINKNNQSFYIKSIFADMEEYQIEIGFNRKKKQIKINEKNIKNLNDLIGLVNIIVFLQNDLELIEGSPDFRRKFLNILFSQVDKVYFHNLIIYNKLLRYRNKFLKEFIEDKNLFISINENIARAGFYLVNARKKFIKKLNNIFKLLIKEQDIQLSYKTIIGNHDDYLRKLNENVDKERKLGFTLIGPHRDDLFIEKQNMKLNDISSTGEKRLVSLVLKLSEFYFIKELRSIEPIILMDDILLELDKENRTVFLNMINFINTQFFITSTNKHNYLKLNNLEVLRLNE